MPTVTIGDHAIDKIVEIAGPFMHAQDFFPDLTADMLETCRRELPAGQIAANGFLNMSYHCFLLRTPGRTILIDTCCGNDKERVSRPEFHHLRSGFLATLAAAGVQPEQVDLVMCTHLHWDHVGWNTRLIDGSWVPTFANAKYVIGRTEYEYWDAAHRRGDTSIHSDSFADSVLPVKRAEQVVLVEDDHELDAGIVLEPCFGHSAGHLVVNIASRGARAVVTGDVLHHQIQLRFPSMSTRADTDRERARQTRTALIEKHAGTGTLLLPAHFVPPSVGRIERAGEGFRYAPLAGT